jgi:protein ImuB
MSILCLWSPGWRTGGESAAEVVPLILEVAPRVVLEGRGVVWVDVRGLPAFEVAGNLLERLWEVEGVCAGVSAAPIVAEAAARYGEDTLTVVEEGGEVDFLAGCPLALLTGDERLLTLLEGSGVGCCGDLAALTAEAVEVRFGSEGRAAWRLARGDDPRLLFTSIPPERPHASVDFVDYTVRDATRLIFTLNALLEQVCDELRARARRARSLTLHFELADGRSVREILRTARPTADRALWIRRLRSALERIRLPDAIVGVSLEVDAAEPVSALQGDLFDRGFSTAAFVEEAVTRLTDLYRDLFVRQIHLAHPLAERRARWVELFPQEAAEGGERSDPGAGSALELYLLPEPKPIGVRTRARRDHLLPIRYRDGKEWHELVAAGPDRISGGHEEARPYAREYYRCASGAGALLWIYRDAIDDRWYLHGWWD